MIDSKLRKVFFFITLAAAAALLGFFVWWLVNTDSEMETDISVILQFMEILCVVFTIMFTVQQIVGSKEVAKGTFIMDLNKSYVDNPENIKIYNILQSQFDSMQSTNPAYRPAITDSIEKSSISNYLTFFETLYILKNRGVIEFEIIDDLFAYRFFLAVHSELFQELKLKPQPENFRNIFKLEKEWLDYRVKIGKITRAELDETYKNYSKLSDEDKKSYKWKNVYVARQLRCLVDDENEYKKLIGKKSWSSLWISLRSLTTKES